MTHHDLPPQRPRDADYSQPASGLERGYARSRARDEAIRAQLEPLAPGERPLGLKLAIALALVLGAANAIAAAAAEAYVFAAVTALVTGFFVAGLWSRQYLAVVLFQGLLALGIVFAAMWLLFASNVWAVLLAVGLIAACAPVFWMLVRVMARLQVPPR